MIPKPLLHKITISFSETSHTNLRVRRILEKKDSASPREWQRIGTYTIDMEPLQLLKLQTKP